MPGMWTYRQAQLSHCRGAGSICLPFCELTRGVACRCRHRLTDTQCGLTAEEGEKKLQEELAALFDKGMAISAQELKQRAAINKAPTSALGYSVSQHYHHSAHRTTPAVAQEPSSSDMDMEPAADKLGFEQTPEPYMYSGYEYLANRDYQLQVAEHRQSEQQHAQDSGQHNSHVLDPGLSPREWWVSPDHQPIEYQHGMLEHVSNRGRSDMVRATEDAEMS